MAERGLLMKRYIRIATLAFAIGTPCLSQSSPYVEYIVGGVGIHGDRDQPIVRSAADAAAYNSQGELLINRILQGFHNIHVEDSPTIIVAGESIYTTSPMTSFVTTNEAQLLCYEARFNVRAIGAFGNGRYIDVTEGPYCVPDSACQDFTACSPLLLDLDNNGFHLVGLENGVVFDIDADGVGELVSWTASDDAFLCLDRDGDGVIGSGAELFGNATPTVEGGALALNGFHALESFDAPALGGNADGRISPEDAVYQSLCLWSDANHNGTSEARELHGLEAAGVVDLELSYRAQARRDKHGNLFRYLSSATIANAQGQLTHKPLYDVYLRVAQ